MIVLFSADRHYTQSLCLLAGALLFLILGGCAQNPVSGNYDFVMLSEDSELEIGRTNHPKIIAQYGYYKDEILQQYVQTVGDRLAKESHRDNLIYRFTVLDSPVVNAFALPGGYIYITRGLMAYLNSEAELAAVLGHEIGHVTARHGIRQQSASQAVNLVYSVGALAFPGLGGLGSRQLFNLFGGALLSGYGREHELESDRLGAEYIAKAGYDSNAMIDVIKVLKAQSIFAAEQAKKQGREPRAYHGLFATHPDNDTRLHEVVESAEKYSLGSKAQRLPTEYLNKIEGLVFGNSEEQGIHHGRDFYHKEMDIMVSFPVGWQTLNHPDSVSAISPGGQAFIEMKAAYLNRKLSIKEFIKQRLKINNLREGRAINVHGLKGYTGLFSIKKNPARVSVIYKNDRAFIFYSGVKDGKQFDRFDVEFLLTAKSLHGLSEEEKILATSLEIEVVTTTKADNYATWAAQSRISNSPLLQLKLLNAHYPQGELQAGQRVKRIK